MKKITYGVPRLVDWVAQIKVGAATLRVHFTGGALTAYGVTPAEYTTSDPFIQKVIEQSNYFKQGRIIIQRQIETDEPRKRVPKGQPKGEPAPQPTPVETEAEGTATAGPTKVEVTCLPDAQAYLQENFNISSYKVRNCETAQKIAYEHGFEFTGGKFDTLDCGGKSEEESEEEG